MRSTSGVFLLVITCFLLGCRQAANGPGRQSEAMQTQQDHPKHTNVLIEESSPYLLQHAHNPVNWYPWKEEVLQKAKEEGKMMLVSIGYSACHWCHVMEHESFEDTAVAAFMNEHFICIKVDREERPDVDQVYMHAVQLITGQGGWPLNCFTLPDGRPFYGGTYFPRQQWMQLLRNIVKAYQEQPEKLREYAAQLTASIANPELAPVVESLSEVPLKEGVEKWKTSFDMENGGPARAPKFPLPNNYQYLLRYAHFYGDDMVREHVRLTLKKMAFGGIYDQAGGGFARYSTDMQWKVPHFEKMLYDNAQLVTLYSEAYRSEKEPLYKEVVYETLEFVRREMTSEEGIFYSALDADSEGEEGKFYIWKEEELKKLLGEDFNWVKDFYNVNARGLWEHGNYILLRDQEKTEIAQKHNMPAEQLDAAVKRVKKVLLEARAARPRLGLDDKSLTSWNALMMKAYVDAYATFGHPGFLEVALRNADFLGKRQRKEDGGLYHSYKNGKSSINGYLEDYAFTIEALLALYEATFDRQWLDEADQLAAYCRQHFFDEKSGHFFFTSDLDSPLIARKMELSDNVIPASGSAMARSLHKLGHILDRAEYLEIADRQLKSMAPQLAAYAPGYSNWGMLLLDRLFPYYEIAICGKEALERRKEMAKYYIPNSLFTGSTVESDLPLLENKWVKGETFIYVCVNKTCQLPVKKTDEALKQIR